MVEDNTLDKYAITLRKLIHGVFESCSEHPSGYAFPLTDDDKRRAKKFREALVTFSTDFDIGIGQDGDQIEDDDKTLEQDEDEILDDDETLEQDEDEILDDDEIDSERKVYDKHDTGTVILEALLDNFHQLIKPFLYPQLSTSHSRWDDTLECFVALLSLSSKGNFKKADGMSQYFAHFHYWMRSVMFYEALYRKKNSIGDHTFE